MQVHLTFLSLSLTCILLSYTLFPRGEWPFSLWVIACFSSSSLYLYISDGFTFPDPHIGLFPLNLVGGWPKSQTVPLQPTARWRLGTSIASSYHLFLFIHDHACRCFVHLCICLVSYFNHTCMHNFHGFICFCRKFDSITAKTQKYPNI